jgi:hypothetical protein
MWTRSPNFHPLDPAAQASNTPLIKRRTWLAQYIITIYIFLDLFFGFNSTHGNKQVHCFDFINIHF